VVRHDALRRRKNGDAEPVVDARQRPDRGIDPAARLRHALDLADHRRAVEVLQLDLELAAAVLVLDAGVAADVTLALEHVEETTAQLRAGGRDLRLLAHLRVADAGDQIADGIVQCHATLLTSST